MKPNQTNHVKQYYQKRGMRKKKKKKKKEEEEDTEDNNSTGPNYMSTWAKNNNKNHKTEHLQIIWTLQTKT